MTGITATDRMMRMNMRGARAQTVTSMIIRELIPFLPHEDAYRGAYKAILDLLTAQGVEVITDDTRAELGLEIRSDDGWTHQEIIALDRVRLEMMMRPRSYMHYGDGR